MPLYSHNIPTFFHILLELLLIYVNCNLKSWYIFIIEFFLFISYVNKVLFLFFPIEYIKKDLKPEPA